MKLHEVIKRIWSLDGILVDKNHDDVVDGVSLYLQLDQDNFPVALIDLFARIGYETTALSYNFFQKNNQKYTLRFEEADETEIKMTENEIILYYSTFEELNCLLTEIATTNVVRTNDAIVPEISSLSHLWDFSGFGYAHEASPNRELSVGVHVEQSTLSKELGQSLCHFFARASLLSTQFKLPIAEKSEAKIQFHLVEAEENKVRLVKENHLEVQGTYKQLPNIIQQLAEMRNWSEGGSFGNWEQSLKQPVLQDDLMLHKRWSGRSEVARIEEILQENNEEVASFKVYISRSKEVRQRLKSQWEKSYDNQFDEVYSSFKTAFHWFEEELIPNFSQEEFDEVIISVKEDQEDGLELPIRWIQEIYPVDLLIEKSWGISKEAVQFKCKKEQAATYIVYGKKKGEQIELGQLTVPVMKIDYVEKGKYAYPSTSAVVMNMKDGTMKTKIIETDRYAFYRYYTEEILPYIKKEVQNYRTGQGHTRPFFDRIEVNVWMNEDERKLELDEERISSLEALHEDLYFNTLDYFAYWGEEVEGKPFHAPGGIYPFMHICETEQPKAEIKVYRWQDDELPKVQTRELLVNEQGEITTAVVYQDEKRLVKSVNDHTLNKSHIHSDVESYLKDNAYSLIVSDYSYRGLQIPSIECFLSTNEQFDAPIKMTMQKKTIIIEAGHHANEVSSTPAVMKLIQDITEDMLKKVNIVVIPLANMDGYQLLLDLIKEHPEWKHHAARYNAVGLEYSYVRFKKSIFGEANVLPNLLKRWAADVIVDDHGIPSHEWVQPFAGYNSPPRFPVSYFLPSAKMYGIGKLPIMKNRLPQEENFKAVKQVVCDEIGKTDIAQMNEYWRSRYQKYGHDWLPEVFLIERAEHLNFYEMEVEQSEKAYQLIGRYPEWIAADIITEAADEIVYGDVLESCIDAQYVFNLALIKQLIQTKTQYKDSTRKLRQRPIQLVSRLTEEK